MRTIKRRHLDGSRRGVPSVWSPPHTRRYVLEEIEAELEPEVADPTDESDWCAFAWWPYRP